MRRKWQTNLERNARISPMPVADLTEKQCRANKIAAAPPSLNAWVR
jgi:hypothetical protein